MSERSNGNGSPNGALSRLPGETGTDYTNRKREAEREARAQQERERLDALTSQAAQLVNQAAQLVQTLARTAEAIPPDLSQQLAAVRSEMQEARNAAAQVRTAATSAATTMTGTAERFAATTAKAETWHKVLTATEERGTKTAQTIERAAARAGAEVRSVRWRAWLTGGVGPTLLLLALGSLFWIVAPLRATVAAWWMTEAQETHQRNGRAIEDSYESPQATAVDRCLMESYARWPRRQPCPPPPPGSGLNALTRPTPKRGK